MTMTDIDEKNLEAEIVMAVKDIAGKKAALTTMERSFSSRRKRRRIMWSISGAAALTCAALSLSLFHSPSSMKDSGGIRGGEMASDKVERLVESRKYEEALEAIDEARANLTIDEGLSEEARDYQRQVIADERRKLDSLEKCLRIYR